MTALTDNEVVPFVFTYRNYRGEVSNRRVVPIYVRFGSTEWHPEPQWLLNANDLDKGETREFAMKDIGAAKLSGGAGEPAGYLHTITEPDSREFRLYADTSDNPWSHWMANHLDKCVYSCTPLYATPPAEPAVVPLSMPVSYDPRYPTPQGCSTFNTGGDPKPAAVDTTVHDSSGSVFADLNVPKPTPVADDLVERLHWPRGTPVKAPGDDRKGRIGDAHTSDGTVYVDYPTGGGTFWKPEQLQLWESHRDLLGRIVRAAWVKWARQQSTPKPSWLVGYDELSEADKEADRQIGEALKAHLITADAATIAGLRARDVEVSAECNRLIAAVNGTAAELSEALATIAAKDAEIERLQAEIIAKADRIGRHSIRAGKAEERAEAAEARITDLQAEVGRKDAEIAELKGQKWFVQHTDTMNDLVQMGMARDDAEAEVEKVRGAFMAAIEFTMKTDEPTAFLKCWNEGDWPQIAQDWPEFDLSTTGQTAALNAGERDAG